MKFRLASVCSLLAFLVSPPVTAAERDWALSGDFRVLLYAENWRDTREGRTVDAATSGARFRLRLQRNFSEHCRFQTRFAATLEDSGNEWEVYLRSHRDSGTSVNPGTATLDEFFLTCGSPDGRSQWRVGRMQSNLDLPHMPTRSFDRSQASSINIGWTDGIAYRHQFTNGWYADLMAQYNGPEGNGQTFRGPISFHDSDARLGYFGILGSDEVLGPIFMRALSLTVYPDTLAVAGQGSADREDYILAAFKLGARWNLDDRGRRLVAVGEVAHALNAVDNSVLRLDGEGEADAWGWQFGLDLHELIPKHAVGINYGQSGGSMLLSNDFRENNELFEWRWRYEPTTALRIEFRARWRRELERQIGAEFLQRDRDIWFRTTYRF